MLINNAEDEKCFQHKNNVVFFEINAYTKEIKK